MSAVGGCEAGTAALCGAAIKTVHGFQHVAARRAQEHHAQVTQGLRVEGVPRDERHPTRRRRRVGWRHPALAVGRLCLLWVHWGLRTPDSAALLIAQVGARLDGLPVWRRDGGKADPAARLQVLGRVYRRRRGRRGPPPKPRLVPPQDLCAGQVVKVRDRRGKLRRVVSRVVYGGPRRFTTERASRGLRPASQTACMARWYGTLRGLCAPLRRRTRCGSSRPSRHHARVWGVVDLYTFVLPHQRLRQQGRPHTPAMASGRAQHVRSSRDSLWYPGHPAPFGRQLMEPRVKERLTPALETG